MFSFKERQKESDWGNLVEIQRTLTEKAFNKAVDLHASSGSSRLVEIFLYYPYTKLFRYYKNNFNYLFPEEPQNISGHPVFLEKRDAMTYSQFMSEKHVIIQAVVIEGTIQANGRDLILNRQPLLLCQIRGCYLGWTKSRDFVSNTTFDKKLLKQK